MACAPGDPDCRRTSGCADCRRHCSPPPNSPTCPCFYPVLFRSWGRHCQELRQHSAQCTIGVLLVALPVSAAPIMLLNQLHAGHWGGDPTDRYKVQIHNPLTGVIGNSFLLVQGVFMPPVLPAPHQVDTWMRKELPEPIHRMLDEKFPRFSLHQLNEMPGEENASIGLGISLLLCLPLMAAFFRSSKFCASHIVVRFFSSGWPLGWRFCFLLSKWGPRRGRGCCCRTIR